MPDQPISARQLQAIEARVRQALQDTTERLELRKLAMSIALDAVKANGVEPGRIMEFAAGVYAFLIAPATDVRITIAAEAGP
jgi:hypothetical protein